MISPARILAVLAIGLGAWWLAMLSGAVLDAMIDKPLGSWLWFGAFILLIMMIPGALALYYGCGLLREVTAEKITGAVGALCVFGGLWVAMFLQEWEIVFPQEYGAPGLLIAVLVLIPIYLFASSQIIRMEHLEATEHYPSIGRGTITLIAILIWNALSELAFAESGLVGSYLVELGRSGNFVGVLVPILAGWGFYRIGSRFFLTEDSKFREPNAEN